MENFFITTDSGCDLSSSLCEGRGIIPLKLKYTIGSQEYEDSMEPSDCEAFYEKIRNDLFHIRDDPNKYLQVFRIFKLTYFKRGTNYTYVYDQQDIRNIFKWDTGSRIYKK